MIAGQALALPQLLLRAAAELAAVVVASKQECVGDLAAEAARDVNEANQANDGGTWHRHSLAMDWRSLGLDDFGLPVNDQSQRPAHGHHGQRLESRIEGEAAYAMCLLEQQAAATVAL